MKKIYLYLALILTASLAKAQVTYGVYNFTGTGSSCASRVATVTTNNITNGTFGNMTDGAGATCSGTISADKYTITGVNAATSGDAITNDDFTGFTLTLGNNKKFDNISIDLSFTRRMSNITNAPKCFVRAQWDNAGFVTQGSDITLTTSDVLSTVTIAAPGNSTSTLLTVRIYCYSATASTTTFRIDDVTLTAANAPLPISLLSFQGAKVAEKVQLTWSTASEINNDKFIIERSQNADEFEEIATIAGAGNSHAILNYYFTDVNPLKGTSYYRLKQVDFDGTSETFKTIAVNSGKAELNIENVYTSNQKVNLKIYSPIATETTLLIHDISGKLVASEKQILTEGYNQIQINTPTLQPGIHLIKLQGTESVVMKKFVF